MLRGKIFKKQVLTGYLFVLPSSIILFIFVILPIFRAAWLSLYDWSLAAPATKFIGLENYKNLLRDSRFWNAFWNTIYYTITVVPLRIILAFIFALIFTKKLKGLSIFKTIYFLPVISSFAIVGIIWGFLMDPDIGLISYYTRKLGIPAWEWIRSTKWAMPAIITVSIWKWFGFNMVIFLAGLQGIPDSIYEAAKIDGANSWQQILYVTVPMLRPIFLLSTVDAIIASLQVFDVVYVMTRGGPLFSTETLVYYIYYQGFQLFQMGYASSIALILFIFILILTLFQLKFLKFREEIF